MFVKQHAQFSILVRAVRPIRQVISRMPFDPAHASKPLVPASPHTGGDHSVADTPQDAPLLDAFIP